MMPKHVGAV